MSDHLANCPTHNYDTPYMTRKACNCDKEDRDDEENPARSKTRKETGLMRIDITEEQRDHLFAILGTHLHNMETEAVNAHAGDPKRYAFYIERVGRTKALLPLFALQNTEITGEDDESEEA